MTIEINNESGVAVDETVLLRLMEYNLAELHVSPDADVAIILVDEGAMEALHVQWMDEPGPDGRAQLPDGRAPPRDRGHADARRAARRHRALPAGRRDAGARRPKHTTMDELILLTTHGLLHLLGFDHAEPEDEREMFGLQKELHPGLPRRRATPSRA